MQQDFFVSNRKQVWDSMEEGSVLVLFAGDAVRQSADAFYPFHINRNFYYLTGISQAGSILLMVKNSETVYEKLYIADPKVIPHGSDDFPITPEQATEASGIALLGSFAEFEPQLHNLLYGARMDCSSGQYIQHIYGDLERRTIADDDYPSAKFMKKIAQKYPIVTLHDIYWTIANMRRFKTDAEVGEICRAIDITHQGINEILKVAKTCKNECELEAVFHGTLIKNGEREYAFPAIIASGHNAFVPHYGANKRPVLDGDFVLLDLGASSGFYSADVSRAFPANGKFNKVQRELYTAVLSTHKATLAALGEGGCRASCRKVGDALMLETLIAAGYTREEYPDLWCMSGVDHYLGLDTHDVGRYDIPFTAGMVVTVDTAVRIPALDICFRLEDDVLICKDGAQVLSKNIAVEIDEIEALMNG